jgi:hypothetical protein
VYTHTNTHTHTHTHTQHTHIGPCKQPFDQSLSEADVDPNEYGGWGAGAGLHTNLGSGLFEVLHNNDERSWALITKTRQDVREHTREHFEKHMREHIRKHIKNT